MAIQLTVDIKTINPEEVKKLLINIEYLDKSKDYRVYFSDKKTHRSNDLNAYYWGVVLKLISQYTGYTDNELHKIFKARFNLRTRFNGGEIEEYIKSTSKDITSEFMEYLEKIIVWAGIFLGVVIPKPNEVPDELFIKYIDR